VGEVSGGGGAAHCQRAPKGKVAAFDVLRACAGQLGEINLAGWRGGRGGSGDARSAGWSGGGGSGSRSRCSTDCCREYDPVSVTDIPALGERADIHVE